MTTPFEASGFWHLPSDPSRKVAGTLRYSAEDGLRLSLTGSFGEGTVSERKAGKYPVIHGIVDDSPCGRAFTLVSCFRSALSVRMPGFATEEIRANEAYGGEHFLSEDDLSFDAVSLRPPILDDWIDTTGMRIEPPAGEESDTRFHYSRPEMASFPLDTRTLKIGVAWSASQSRRSFSFHENVGIRIENLGHISAKKVFQKYIYPLRNFFTLASDHPCELDSIVFFNGSVETADVEGPSPIHHLAQPIYLSKEPKKDLLAHDMLFTYEDVKHYLPSIFPKWFEFSEIFKPFCVSYFGLLYAPDAFVDGRFLRLIESMVLLFRDLGDHDDSLGPALDEAVKTFQARCSGKNVRWLADVMPTVADVSLPWKLAGALDNYRDLMTPLIGDDVEGFVDLVLTTRRYCQSRDSALAEHSVQGADLYWLTEKLKVLVKTLILEWLGIPRDLIVRLIRRNRVYSYLASLHESG